MKTVVGVRIFLSVCSCCFLVRTSDYQGFPGGSGGKESACNAGDPGSIPGSGRSPGEGKGYPLLYSCLENLTAREAWWAPVHGVWKSWINTTEPLTINPGFFGLFFLLEGKVSWLFWYRMTHRIQALFWNLFLLRWSNKGAAQERVN